MSVECDTTAPRSFTPCTTSQPAQRPLIASKRFRFRTCQDNSQTLSRNRDWEGPEAEGVDQERQDRDREARCSEGFHERGLRVTEAQDYS